MKRSVATGIRLASTGGGVSLGLTAAAWLSLLAFVLGAPWSPFVPGFLLLGAAGLVVGIAATIIERTILSAVSLLAALTQLIAFLVWLSQLETDALS